MEPVYAALQGAGLSEKETKVYVAALELGSGTALSIARKAGVNRATTYLIAENLAARGLMSTHEREGKRFFASEPPAEIISRLNKESETLESRKQAIEDVLPELEALVKSGGARPVVRYYEGLHGLEAMREVLYKNRRHEVLNVLNTEISTDILPLENLAAHQKRMRLYDVRGRIMYTCSDERYAQLVANRVPGSLWQRRRVNRALCPFEGEVVIVGNIIAFISYNQKITGAIIEHPDFAKTMKAIFELAWTRAGELVVKEA